MTDPAFQLRGAPSGPVVIGTPGNVLAFAADGRSVHGVPVAPGGVSSWNGRIGAVVPVANDYAASQVANDSSVPGFSVKDALNSLLAGGGGVVLSVFGRIGAVVAANGDYTTSLVTNASTVSGATTTDALNTVQTHLTSLDGSVVSLGGLISGLQASNIHNNSTGPGTTVADTLTAYNTHLSSLDGSVVSLGSLITNLKASNIGNDSSVTGSTVKDALNNLVTSVNVAGALTVAGTATAPIVTTVGGLRTGLLDNAARDGIPLAQRDVGTTAYVVGTDKLWRLIGGTANANWVDVTIGPVSNTVSGIVPSVGTVSTILQSTGTAAVWTIPLTWDPSIASPTIQQGNLVTNGATAHTLLINGQNETGTTSTGGAVTVNTGTGTLAGVGTNTSPGPLTLQRGGMTVASWTTAGNDFLTLGLAAASAGAAGNSAAGTGTIRTTRLSSWKARNNGDTADVPVIDWGGGGTDLLTIGAGANTAGIVYNSNAAGHQFNIGGVQKVSVANLTLNLFVGNVTWNNTNLNPTISQLPETSLNTSQAIVIQAQNNTHAGGTSVGGAVNLVSGTGTLKSGPVQLQAGGVVKFAVEDAGVGFYAHATAAQAADMVAITDSTTGVVSTTVNDVGVVFNQATLNNNFASLASQINKVRTALRATGYMA